MPAIPIPTDILTRYIRTDRYIKADNTVRYNAFMPANNNTTSVFNVTGLVDADIWAIAVNYISSIVGRADIQAEDVTNEGLQLDPNEPPVRHVDIIGWSEDKSQNQLKAKQIVRRATLHLVP